MAFSFTITKTGVEGNRKTVEGAYANSSSTGGTIKTGLNVVTWFELIPSGATANTNAPVLNADLPVAGDSVVIVTDSNKPGFWKAEGY